MYLMKSGSFNAWYSTGFSFGEVDDIDIKINLKKGYSFFLIQYMFKLYNINCKTYTLLLNCNSLITYAVEKIFKTKVSFGIYYLMMNDICVFSNLQ